jgi:hypothetical protein
MCKKYILRWSKACRRRNIMLKNKCVENIFQGESWIGRVTTTKFENNCAKNTS